MKTLGQIAHDAGKFDRQWQHMGESQKADWGRIAQAVIEAQQVAVPAWVSVSERMPERVDVLIYSPDLRNPCDQLVGRFMDGGWHCAGYEMLNVTHWMPLPDAPQGDKL